MKAINALILAVLMSVSVSVATVVDGSAEAERRTDALSRMANCTIAPENDEVEPERDDVDEDTKKARLAIVNATCNVIKSALGLLGIDVVESM